MADEILEAVDPAGRLFRVPRGKARRFARLVGISDTNEQNFPRAMDPEHKEHHFVEDWQGLYNVQFLEKLDDFGNVIDSAVIWGQPYHSMQKFYHALRNKWAGLPSFGTFRQVVAKSRKNKKLRVPELSFAAKRERLTPTELPAELRVVHAGDELPPACRACTQASLLPAYLCPWNSRRCRSLRCAALRGGSGRSGRRAGLLCWGLLCASVF